MAGLLNAKDVADELFEVLSTGNNPALFAGAGVGARAGLPTWSQFMEHLAAVADRHDPPTGQLIRHRAKLGDYLGATVVYKSCSQIPQGELYHELGSPFLSVPCSQKLDPLLSLPFVAVLTTNYDRSLHDSYSAVFKKSCLPVELDDPTMKKVPYLTSFYIARVHGRAELPETMVLDGDDYRRTQENDDYLDTIRHALTRYTCLFLGFSFMDPAINRVFQVIKEQLGPNFPAQHVAFLPDTSDEHIRAQLASINVRTVFYSSSNEHADLWEGIAVAARRFSQQPMLDKPVAIFPLDSVHKFLATSYARARLEGSMQPLRDIVVDGIIMSILVESGDHGSTLGAVSDQLRQYLSISLQESRRLVERRLESLQAQGLCCREEEVVRAIQEGRNVLQQDISILVKGAMNRVLVREGQPTSSYTQRVVAQTIEETLVARGWDLGAHFAGAKTADITDLLPTLESCVRKHGSRLSDRHVRGLALACYDLFQRPDERESQVLAALGRVAFGLQLVVCSPSAAVTHRTVLPERIYLDANVLMPLIVDGHPYHPVYTDAFARLNKATTQAGTPVAVVVADQFLNEVISHKRKACDEVQVMSLSDPDALSRHIMFYGAENTNIFIGAYATWVGRSKERIPFDEFLRQAAPYRSESDLALFLSGRGISTVKLSFECEEETALYKTIIDALGKAYATDTSMRYDQKPFVLIDHEAKQLTQLNLDLERGIRAILVTADTQLRRHVTGDVLGKPGRAVLSHRALVQLIDMLLGFKSDSVSMTRLLWSSAQNDEETAIQNYYTNLALQHYDEAMAMSLPEVLQSFVPRVTDAARAEHIVFFQRVSTDSKARRAKFLDRFENEFFTKMSEVVRRRQLENDIREIQQRIEKHEARQPEARSAKQKAEWKEELRLLTGDLDDRMRELELLKSGTQADSDSDGDS